MHWLRRSTLAMLLIALAASTALASFTEVEVSGNTTYLVSRHTVGDVNDDGHADIIAFRYNVPAGGDDLVWYDQNNAWSRDTITGTFTNALDIDVGELNGDAASFDLVVCGWDRNWVSVYTYEFDLDFGDYIWNSTIVLTVDDPVGLEVVDLDEDGDNDIVYSYANASGNGGWGWLENDGSGSFTDHRIDSSRDYHYFDVANVDNSGGLDVVLAADGAGDVYVFTNDGAESFTSSSLGMSVTDPIDVVAANFDDSDAAYEYFIATDFGETLYMHDGGTTTTVVSKTTGTRGVMNIEAADLDEDGDLDVVAGWRDDEEINWYENTPGFSFTERTIESTNGFDYGWVSLGDIDGSGTTDVVSSVYGNGSGTSGVEKLYYFQSVAGVENTVTNGSWQLIGVPVAISPAADGIPTTLFADDIDESYGAPNWVMSRWNQASNDYIRFLASGQNSGEPPLISPGYGYWFIQTDGANRTLDILHETVNTGAVTLSGAMPDYEDAESRNGFGMFANPFNEQYDVNNMTFADGDSWATATSSYNLNAYIYTWDGSQHSATSYDNPATLDPWEGFWLIRTDGANDTDIDVTFGTAASGPRTGQIADTRQVVHEFLAIELASTDGEYTDPSNRLGVRSNSQDSYDPWDAFDLGSMNNDYVRFSFPHEEWDTPGKFAFDYRQSRWETKPVWDGLVEMVNTPNTTFEMTFPNASELPENVDIQVSALHGENARPVVLGTVRDLPAITLTSGPENYQTRQFRFEVVPTAGRTLDADDPSTSALPETFAISNISPNPFNPTTTVKVALPAAAELTVAVFNVAGQRVATLVEGSRAAGQHRFVFDASGLSSGIYFVQATVPGELNAMRKIMLVK